MNDQQVIQRYRERYPWIMAYCRSMGSHAYWVAEQLEIAVRINAPTDTYHIDRVGDTVGRNTKVTEPTPHLMSELSHRREDLEGIIKDMGLKVPKD